MSEPARAPRVPQALVDPLMADVCGRCSGKGWYWNGERRVQCGHARLEHYQLISREEWPAVKARLLERGRA